MRLGILLFSLIFLWGCGRPSHTQIQNGPQASPSPRQEVPKPKEEEKLEPNFASIKSQILEKKCFLCHNPSGSGKRVSLDSVEEMINSPLEIVIPGDPDSSDLILVLRSDARKPMPPVESKIPAVSQDQVRVIREWISNGAKD